VVSDDLRQRVLKVIADLGYRPSPVAQGLRLKSSKTIALLLPEIDGPFFPSLIKGAEEVARENDFSLVVCNTNEDSNIEREYLKSIRSRWIDGLIMSGVKTDESNRHAIRELAKERPVVFVDREVPGVDSSSVTIDNLYAGYEAVSYLISKGHRKIAHIAGPLNRELSKQRALGYRKALLDAGLQPDESLCVEGDFRLSGGEMAMERLLEFSHPPTAVFAANDQMAIGALQSLRARGLRVPDDIALIGFDDIPTAEITDPPLTTMAQPIERMGQEGVKMLLARLRGEESNIRRVVLSANLVVRCTA